ncbi:hypothetical protein QUG40_23590 [Enterobacter cloacae]|uniref:hypothetical protein n=1 Tax=Enterobacter cloacae TaxID=550 RepID=UPI002003EE2A|nr:hypothetical protein [Enterobacter cloacae]MCK7044253.1 hypothetical protein [Enterobacter cloacae]MDM6891603.1 hypothetical protein [Enterobacter cloacae]
MPQPVHAFPAYLPFDIHYPLWRAVGLAVEPEDLWGINVVSMYQRVITVWSQYN